MSTRRIENFGGNLRFTPTAFYTPKSEAEVLEILNRHRGQPIRVMGRLHSWSQAAETQGVLLDLRELRSVKVVHAEGADRAVVGAGCQIKQVLKELERQGGWTLPSIGLITEQTIAGAISTGTHGSGRHSISHYVQSARIACYDKATGQGIIREVSQGTALEAARCSLGCLGVLLSVTISCRKQYRIEEHLRQYDTLKEVIAAETDYPLQQFFLIPWSWNYQAQHRRETEAPRSWLARLYRAYWFLNIDLGMHVLLYSAVRIFRSQKLARFLYRHVLPKLAIRRWRVVDHSQSMLVMEHELFRHIEMELFVQAPMLEPALEFVKAVLIHAAGESPTLPTLLVEHDAEESNQLHELAGCYSHHYPICIRRIVPDDTLISMSSGGNESWYAISLISYENVSRRDGFFRVMRFLAQAMAKRFRARPHWGKLCPLAPNELIGLYDRFGEFREACQEFDPEGVFQNAWMRELLDQTKAD